MRRDDLITAASFIIISIMLLYAFSNIQYTSWDKKYSTDTTSGTWKINTTAKIIKQVDKFGVLTNPSYEIKIDYDVGKVVSNAKVTEHTLDKIEFNIKTERLGPFGYAKFKVKVKVESLINAEKEYGSFINKRDKIELNVVKEGATGTIYISVSVTLEWAWGGRIEITNIVLVGTYKAISSDSGGNDSNGSNDGSNDGSSNDNENTGSGGGSATPITISDTGHTFTIASWIPQDVLDFILFFKELIQLIVLALTAIVLYATVRRGKG